MYMAEGLKFELDTKRFKKQHQKILRAFGKDAPRVLSTELRKIADAQTKNIKRRLKNPKMLKKQGRSVAKQVSYKVTGKSQDKIEIVNIGAEPSFGQGRAVNLNFSALLALGTKGTPAAVGSGTNPLYKSPDGNTEEGEKRGFFQGGWWNNKRVGIGRGKKFKIGKVYGKKQEPEDDFFPKAIRLTEQAIEKDLGPALKAQWAKYENFNKRRGR
tara:strand:+ start:519 stop:1160 length:642 start_codon:yes stop_codon:yes gene_type:complete